MVYLISFPSTGTSKRICFNCTLTNLTHFLTTFTGTKYKLKQNVYIYIYKYIKRKCKKRTNYQKRIIYWFTDFQLSQAVDCGTFQGIYLVL